MGDRNNHKSNTRTKSWKRKKAVKQYNNEPHQNKANHSPDKLCIDRNKDVPYYGWKLFFSDKEYKADCSITKQIKAIEAFIERHEALSVLFTMKNLEIGMSFDIDIYEFYNDDKFMKQWPMFKDEMYENPTDTLNCIKLAIHQKIFETIPEENLQYVLNSISSLPTIKVNILNYQPVICLRDVKLNCYGKLVCTRGCVTRVGRVKYLSQWMVFACSKCHLQKLVKHSEELYTLPKQCDVCGVSKFYPVLDSPCVKSILFQMIRIQEPLNDEQDNKGRVPKVLDVELTDHLVNICMPGDDITLTGIMKVQDVDDSVTKVQVGTPFSLYMKAITVINNKHRYQNNSSMNNEISFKNYLTIQDIYKEPNIFALLVHSLCPNIYGHEMVKAGLLLSLFGGNAKRAQFRDDIHVLLVGDPGLGKSQMLQACARVSAKGIYICGNASTSSGLTITLSKETGSNDFALEPGALVLADQGCCCIDEFDKMCSQHQALLESMEQQRVTVAKSGVICSLPARTSILAAANPIGGQYDKSKTITENLNISQPILSRFDLIFLLLDKPDENFDNFLCKHIMTVHTSSHNAEHNEEALESFSNDECSLRKKLMLPLSTKIILQPVLRTYISYARQYVKPKLSTKAATALQNYYLELRSKIKQVGSIPIFNRQLEAMIRLTEARAKLELRVEATESDALDVIDLMRYAMGNLFDDTPTPKLCSDGKLTNKKVKTFLKVLEKNTDKEQTFSVKELKTLAVSKGILIDDFTALISKLNEAGILLKIKKDTYKLIYNNT